MEVVIISPLTHDLTIWTIICQNMLFKDFYIVISTDTVKGIQVLLADTWYNYALY